MCHMYADADFTLYLIFPQLAIHYVFSWMCQILAAWSLLPGWISDSKQHSTSLCFIQFYFQC